MQQLTSLDDFLKVAVFLGVGSKKNPHTPSKKEKKTHHKTEVLTRKGAGGGGGGLRRGNKTKAHYKTEVITQREWPQTEKQHHNHAIPARSHTHSRSLFLMHVRLPIKHPNRKEATVYCTRVQCRNFNFPTLTLQSFPRPQVLTPQNADSLHRLQALTPQNADNRHWLHTLVPLNPDNRHWLQTLVPLNPDNRHWLQALVPLNPDNRHWLQALVPLNHVTFIGYKLLPK